MTTLTDLDAADRASGDRYRGWLDPVHDRAVPARDMKRAHPLLLLPRRLLSVLAPLPIGLLRAVSANRSECLA